MTKKNQNEKISTYNLTLSAILGSLCIILSMTPLGYIPIGPIVATTIHIPVLIGAMAGSGQTGILVGLIFGFSSMIKAIISPTPTSFVNLNPLVSIFPRFLLGLVSGQIYKRLKNREGTSLKRISQIIFIMIAAIMFLVFFKRSRRGEFSLLYLFVAVFCLAVIVYQAKADKKDNAIILTVAISCFIHTFTYLFMLYLIYGKRYMLALGQNPDNAFNVIMAVGITNGIPEMILAILICLPVVKILNRRR